MNADNDLASIDKQLQWARENDRNNEYLATLPQATVTGAVVSRFTGELVTPLPGADEEPEQAAPTAPHSEGPNLDVIAGSLGQVLRTSGEHHSRLTRLEAEVKMLRELVFKLTGTLELLTSPQPLPEDPPPTTIDEEDPEPDPNEVLSEMVVKAAPVVADFIAAMMNRSRR
ncbi:MAG: hypothetical protein A2Y78_06725 [Acidobacteria bacterium RBG_13_68_16]|nr:MAG: hypothetical protein A2Y78_06725 [Acidobacteria bacterium RBG_13_68_16]